jgi:large subunit ribosomal protein L35
MPKMKTHRGAAKRFSKTGTGKIKRNRAFKNHLLEKKAQHRKRRLRKAVLMSKGDQKRIAQLITYVK